MLSIAKRIEMLPELRLRASAGGDLAGAITRLTDKQTEELATLLAKPSPTALQLEKIADYQNKRDNPTMTQGAKTFVEKWLWENLRQKKMELNNKYLGKGLIVEDESIDIADRFEGWDFAMKNEKHYENEWFTGTPDLIIEVGGEKIIIDIKSSWSEETFKFFDPSYDRGYYYQLQIYMALTGIRRAGLRFVLTDTPVHLIRKEALNYIYTFGYELEKGQEVEDTEVYARLYDKMTFKDLPDELRVKKIDFNYNERVIDELIEGVRVARKYKNVLIESFFNVKNI